MIWCEEEVRQSALKGGACDCWSYTHFFRTSGVDEVGSSSRDNETTVEILGAHDGGLCVGGSGEGPRESDSLRSKVGHVGKGLRGSEDALGQAVRGEVEHGLHAVLGEAGEEVGLGTGNDGVGVEPRAGGEDCGEHDEELESGCIQGVVGQGGERVGRSEGGECKAGGVGGLFAVGGEHLGDLGIEGGEGRVEEGSQERATRGEADEEG